MWDFNWVVNSQSRQLIIRQDGKVVHTFIEDDGQWSRMSEDGEHQPVERWVSVILDVNLDTCGGLSNILDSVKRGE